MNTSEQPLRPPKSARRPSIVGLGVAGAGIDDDEARISITSPHELTAFVENMLNDLETRFDSMSEDVLSRLNNAASKADAVESSLARLIDSAQTASGAVSSPKTEDEK